jgi:hypothetical protein
LTGLQLLCLGLASEILSRTYYESQKKPIYATRQIRSHESELSLAWKREPGAVRGTRGYLNGGPQSEVAKAAHFEKLSLAGDGEAVFKPKSDG